MARGWESKSVEQQIEDRDALSSSPEGGNAHPNAQREREIEVLELSRKRLLQELETITHERLRTLKLRALAHVEGQLSKARDSIEN